jgi:hypothetical protein
MSVPDRRLVVVAAVVGAVIVAVVILIAALAMDVDGIYAAISALGIGVFVGGGLGGLIGARLSVGTSDEPE